MSKPEDKKSIWQTALEKVKRVGKRLALLGVTATAVNPMPSSAMASKSNSGSDGAAAKIVKAAEAKPYLYEDENALSLEDAYMVFSPAARKQTQNANLAATMLERNDNVLANFDLSNREWTREELKMIGSCSANDAILKTAGKSVKSGKPQAGEQTYCLGAIKTYLAKNGITLDASRSAYKAIAALQNNPKFQEIKVDYKNYTALPDGAIVVFDKGDKHPHGHIFCKSSQTWRGNTVNYQLCDYRYYLTDRKYPGYGEAHIFLLKDMTVSKELLNKLAEENRISTKYKAQLAVDRMNKHSAIQAVDNSTLAQSNQVTRTTDNRQLPLAPWQVQKRNGSNSM